MKPEKQHSSPLNPPKFDFPTWPESSPARSTFDTPSFPPALEDEHGEAPTPPFIMDQPTSLPRTTESPFGVPLSDLKRPKPVRRKLSLRLLSITVKTALICLLGAVGWFSYEEFLTGTNSESIAEVQESVSTWLLSEGNSAASQEMLPVNQAKPIGNEGSSINRKNDSPTTKTVASAPGENSIQPKSPPLDKASVAAKSEASIRQKLDNDKQNPELIIKLADNLTHQGRQDEAWLLLAKSTMVGNKDFASRILSLGLETDKYDESLILIEPEAKGAPKWDDADWIVIALLHEKSGNTKHALELLEIHDTKKEHTQRIVALQHRIKKTANLN